MAEVMRICEKHIISPPTEAPRADEGICINRPNIYIILHQSLY